ncbi:5'-nucleotidase SurE [Neochlamydia sp. TUME1]|uniref:5'/3'-nucleotidase SurE n=1 Tax=unclassified Neochlamydia TaxID=2643326 RepID=UPI00057F623A|nr:MULTISPECIES: 5'/3'-nucleotidase SurE [unclassified Neochlamydia]KIC76734.1 5'-nucleotidase SurE [Neochlamydia sp. TUME1]BBI18305.1 5'-nucleotidase [Neochlamydia sp. S13]
MSKRPHLLITNDDGIYAPGIRHLWNALKDFADITIVAPATEQSAVGVSITVRNPLRLHQVEWAGQTQAWSLTGTPADCVKMGLKVILDRKPDLIVSGINRGSNAGRNLMYSGTVGGTIEGIIQGVPGIAFSCVDYFNTDYQKVEHYVPLLVDYVVKHPLPSGSLLNVNFPTYQHEIKGFKLTRQGKEFWAEDPLERNHPAEGHSYYWLGAKLQQFEEHEDSDISWLARGYIAAVPVHVGELTDLAHFNEAKSHFEDHLNLQAEP